MPNESAATTSCSGELLPPSMTNWAGKVETTSTCCAWELTIDDRHCIHSADDSASSEAFCNHPSLVITALIAPLIVTLPSRYPITHAIKQAFSTPANSTLVICSRIIDSCNSAPEFCAAFSTPAFFIPAIWCHIFYFCNSTPAIWCRIFLHFPHIPAFPLLHFQLLHMFNYSAQHNNRAHSSANTKYTWPLKLLLPQPKMTRVLNADLRIDQRVHWIAPKM